MDFVLFLVFAAIIVYNGFQVVMAMNGKRYESELVLFFFAFAIDIYWFIGRKLTR